MYASYSDHTPASGAKVVLVDANGVIILQDKMDEKGIVEVAGEFGDNTSLNHCR
ncbi:hypothetical protein [Candidatus Kuenenia stuttgartiensis]|uniref:hypothetical protein n=1 Tax=Kuenenia stuttgartiensis TaxID=174633 RepID=UPI0012FF5014|nr:hypothetical protein [Candidatus Kuenenia stuttgartiensis]